jgi:hypothetical protein
MWRYLISVLITFLFLPLQMNANGQNRTPSGEEKIPYPSVPRVSAYEVYAKYKGGKAIILYAGGGHYKGRHIVGSFNMDYKDDVLDKLLPKFPKEGMEIFTYCY